MGASQAPGAGLGEPALSDGMSAQHPGLRLDIMLASDGDLEAFYRLYSAYFSDTAPAALRLPEEFAQFDASAVARQATLLLDGSMSADESMSADDQIIAVKMLTFICALRQPRANVSTVLAAGAMEHVGRRWGGACCACCSTCGGAAVPRGELRAVQASCTRACFAQQYCSRGSWSAAVALRNHQPVPLPLPPQGPGGQGPGAAGRRQQPAVQGRQRAHPISAVAAGGGCRGPVPAAVLKQARRGVYSVCITTGVS